MSVEWGDVAVVCPTVPQRRDMAERLMRRIVSECRGATVDFREHIDGTKPSIDFPSVIDIGLKSGRDWILQIEDDIHLCPCFGSVALDAINHCYSSGINAISFFSRSKKDIEIFGKTLYRLQSPSSFYMAQAVVLKSEIMPGFHEFASEWYINHPEHVHAADILLGSWLSKNKEKLLVRVPSIVQHLVGESSLPGRRAKSRQSKTYTMVYGNVD